MPKWKAFRRNKPSNATRLCPLYQVYDPDFTLVPDEVLTHGYVKPDWPSMVKQIELYDHPDMEEGPSTQFAEDQIVEMLSFHGVSSHEIPLDEVSFNEKANAGVGYQETYGNKGIALKYGLEEINQYWDTAHVVGAFPLYYMFGKIEYLPFTKILENNLRCIECAPITHLAYQLRLCQSFNKSMYKFNASLPIVTGVSFQQGGFDSLIRRISRSGKKFSGDIRKFDKWFMKFLRMGCMRIRVRLYRGLKPQDYKVRMEWVYEHSTSAPVLTPWGQVLVLRFMLSGDGNTTSDDGLGHWIVLFSYIKEEVPNVSHWRDCLNVIGLAIYADDHIGSTDITFDFLAEYQRRSRFYREFGFQLKEEDDLVQDGWPGIKFLGAEICVHKGLFAPKYDFGRIYSSIVFNLLDQPTEIYNKMCSLLLLSTFNGKDCFQKIQDVLKFYVRYFDQEYGLSWTSRRIRSTDFALFKKGLPFIPDYDWCVEYWLGLETKDPRFAIFDPFAVFQSDLKHITTAHYQQFLALQNVYGAKWQEKEEQGESCRTAGAGPCPTGTE